MASPTIISSIIVPASPWFDGGKPHDLVSLGAVKDHIVSDDDDGAKLDGFLKAAITQASDAIRRYCNRVFQLQLYNVQFWAARDAYPWELPGGFMPLQLPHYPIAGSRSLAAAAPPPSAPVLSAVGGGSVSAANYFVRFTYVTPTGETAASLESNLIVAASNLLMVAAPSPDRLAQATGWNVYVGTESGQEIRQNVSPLALGQSWTLPTSGAFTIANGSNLTLPQYILALENVPKDRKSVV